MPGLPNPYVLLAAAGIWLASIVGAYFYGTAHEARKWEASTAKQERDAAALLADLTATAAAKDAAASDFARNLDKEHDDAKRQIADAADAAERDFNKRLRRIAASRQSCPGPGTAQAADAGGAPGSASGSGDGLPEEIGRDLKQVGEAANRLAATVRACVAWAAEVGR